MCTRYYVTQSSLHALTFNLAIGLLGFLIQTIFLYQPLFRVLLGTEPQRSHAESVLTSLINVTLMGIIGKVKHRQDYYH